MMSVAEFVYTVILKPPPLRAAANWCIRMAMPEKVRYGGAEILLNRNDPVVSGALAFRQYEKDEQAFVNRAIQPGMTVLDVGANIGFYTAICGLRTGPEGRVIALEPDPQNFSFLSRTVERNQLKNVDAVQAAAASREGEMWLFTSKDNRGDNRLYAHNQSDNRIRVRVVRLDELLPEMGVAELNFIKIDVQGFEGEVLAGLEETIRRSPKLQILMEFWPEGLRSAGTDPAELLRRLEGWGLKLYRLRSQGATADLGNHQEFISQYAGREYTNIVAQSDL